MLKTLLFFAFILGLMTSCNFFGAGSADERVARVNNKYLYRSELAGIVPEGTSPSDSAVIMQRYVENWVRQQVYLHEAKANLADEQKNFERKVEDYRNSLIIFTHENELINQKLDTVISDDLLAEYYEKHHSEFVLRDNILRLNFVKLPLDAPQINRIRRLIRSENPEDLAELEEYCVNHAAIYFLDQDSWFIFTDILRDIPINPANHEAFLRNNRFVELNDQYYRYFLYIRDYKLEGNASPLTFQADNIRSIILNHRKQKLINDFRKDIYLEALQNNKFEIY